MAGGAGSTAAHLQAWGAGGVGQLRDLGLGCEVQGLGGLLGKTQRQRVRDTNVDPQRGREGRSIPRKDEVAASQPS